MKEMSSIIDTNRLEDWKQIAQQQEDELFLGGSGSSENG